MKTTIINWLLVLFVSLSWGASFMFTRLVVEEISPSHLVSIRLLLAALLLGPLFINKEELLKMSKVIPSLVLLGICLLYTSPSPRDRSLSRMPSSA